MKKTFIIAVSVLLSPLCAHADGYTWNGGGTITTEKWGNQSNWTLAPDNLPWKGDGPGTPNSDMWQDITVKDAKGEIDKLEGWDLDLTLKNAELTINELVKFQTSDTGASCDLNIDANSKLTIGAFGNGTMQNPVAVVNHGQLEINLNRNMAPASFTFDLGGTGVVTIKGTNNLNISSLTANLLATPSSSFTLTSGEGYTAMTRTLMTLSSTALGDFDVDDINIVNTGGLVKGTNRTDTAADIGKYFVEYNNTTGAITLTYVVPEPATATLSLLALAGLAARRRRR